MGVLSKGTIRVAMRIVYRIRKEDFLAAKHLFTGNEKPWYHRISRQLQAWKALYVWLATRWYFWRGYETDQRFKHDFRADISSDGIHVVTSTSEDRIKWLEFVRYLESDKVFMLFVTESKFITFPKRAFAAAELESFRELIRRHIPASNSLSA